ncbi:unnamed protein product [Mycena citricolor]|uniref:Decapping nuclease n=1 Tax=Mycena citricolor TaxID=2018698 RepID=A0AAD2H567_9AGAR|nr:unnamed protein product [Mycena citricolor]
MSKRTLEQIDPEAVPEPSTIKRKLSLSSLKPTGPSPARQQITAPSVQLAYPSLLTPGSPPPAGPSPPFQQPTPLISFSYNDQHELEFNDSALRYLAPPPPRAQLGHGYDRWNRRPEARSRIDGLLRALSAVQDKKHLALSSGVGAVAWRGVLTRKSILTAPYEERESDGWLMNVMCVNGVLYLEEHRDEACLQAKNDLNPRQRRQTYFGYSFESYCTSSAPRNSPNPPQGPNDPVGWGGDVDTNVQWCSVVRTKLGNTRLVIGGEVDCVRDKYTGKTDTFVELKTSISIRGAQDEARFEK